MKISKEFRTDAARRLLQQDRLALQAYQEVIKSIEKPVWPPGGTTFTIREGKNENGVVPIKEGCYIQLEDVFDWYREKELTVLKQEKQKGGPIDVYKEFTTNGNVLRVGLEFETGNISSAHRSMNKIALGLSRSELDLGMILLPIKALAYHLTDRISNFEELEPYFELMSGRPFICIGFDADKVSSSEDIPYIPKGKDGMSKRSAKKWKYRKLK